MSIRQKEKELKELTKIRNHLIKSVRGSHDLDTFKEINILGGKIFKLKNEIQNN